MASAPDTLPVDVPVELIGELADLGTGDIVQGIRIALALAKEVAGVGDRERPDPHTPVLRFLHLAETLDRRSERLEAHIERYEIERKAFLDDVALLGRINEEDPQ